MQKGEVSKERYLEVNSNLKTSTYNYVIFDYIVPSIWLFGAGIVALIFGAGILILNKKIGTNYVLDERILKILNNCKEELKIKNDIKIVVQEYKSVPAIYNLKLLVTQDILNKTDDELKYIFMHELSHFKRNDMFLNYVLIIAQIIHWFNPFVWFVNKKVRQDMELAADELAISKLKKEEHKNYGLSLVNSLIDIKQDNKTYKVLCLSDTAKNMERRINILKLSDNFKKNHIIIGTLSVILILLMSAMFFTISGSSIQKNEFEFNFDKITSYAIPYVGDAVSVRNLVGKVNLGSCIKKIELKTRNKPYELTVVYGVGDIMRNGIPTYSTNNLDIYKEFMNGKTEEEKAQIIETNAVALFSLIDNVDIINFTIMDDENYEEIVKKYSYTRTELEEKYGVDLRKYRENPNNFMRF